jgi:hypothetical protein
MVHPWPVESQSRSRPRRGAAGAAEVREHAGVKYDADVVAACDRVFAAAFEFAD